MPAGGGSAIAYLSADGQWRTRGELRPIDVHGQPITPVKSSFDAPIVLDATATPDEFLEHNVHLIYHVPPGDGQKVVHGDCGGDDPDAAVRSADPAGDAVQDDRVIVHGLVRA